MKIAIDFDGVLAHYKPGMATDDKQGLPIGGAREALINFKDRGFEIIIWTSRPITDNLKKWFEVYAIPYDEIIEKPDCHLFIDDRAIQFKGNWNNVLEEIDNFSEWWR